MTAEAVAQNFSPDEIQSKLAKVETQLAAGELPPLLSSLEDVTSIETWLLSPVSIEETLYTTLIVATITARGHIERAIGENESAVETYGRGLKVLDKSNLAPEVQQRRLSNMWVYRGLAALSVKSKTHSKIALQCFNKSIKLREQESEDGQPESRNWGLSAAWMNRGEALQQFGSIEETHEAIRSFDQAISILESFTSSANPTISTRVALAWMKRGAAFADLSANDGHDRSQESLTSYSNAVTTLRQGIPSGSPESIRMLAMALSNQSRARLQLERCYSPEGEAEARESLALIESSESTDIELLELGLSTRVTLCKTIELNTNESIERNGEITDLAEEGLGIAREVLKPISIPQRFPPIIGQLFRCGAEAYFRYQPQFLGEYLLDHLDIERDPLAFASIPQCHEAAVEIIWRGIGTFQKEGFTGLGSDAFALKLERQNEWQKCRERLAEIRKCYLPPESV